MLSGLALSLVLPFWEAPKVTPRYHAPIEKAYRIAAVGSENGSGYGPKPRKWCGWYMRKLKGVKSPAFNRARTWVTWGRPSVGPTVGAVVVWRNHVGIITGRAANGRWLVHSGNDSNRIRTRPRSLAGAIAFRV